MKKANWLYTSLVVLVPLTIAALIMQQIAVPGVIEDVNLYLADDSNQTITAMLGLIGMFVFSSAFAAMHFVDLLASWIDRRIQNRRRSLPIKNGRE
jgi:hypothetical protein